MSSRNDEEPQVPEVPCMAGRGAWLDGGGHNSWSVTFIPDRSHRPAMTSAGWVASLRELVALTGPVPSLPLPRRPRPDDGAGGVLVEPRHDGGPRGPRGLTATASLARRV